MRLLIIALAAAMALTAAPSTAGVVGDFNEDGRVNIFDVLHLLKVLSNKAQTGDVGKQYVLADGQSYLPGQTLPIDTILGLPMIHLPGGSFVMGGTVSPMHHHGMWPMYMGRAQMHAVGVDSFWISNIEITREQFEEVMGFDPSQYTYSDSLPVHGLSWFDAVRFCNELSLRAGFTACYDTTTWDVDFSTNGFRLPTEAEWEYACRAGTATLFYNGNDEESLQRAGWYDANSEGTVQPVAGILPNNWGLYDMMGNVWEWCNDWYDEQYYGSNYMMYPIGPENGSNRVIRGGAYNSVYSYCSPAFRFYEQPGQEQAPVGLRVVRSAGIP